MTKINGNHYKLKVRKLKSPAFIAGSLFMYAASIVMLFVVLAFLKNLFSRL